MAKNAILGGMKQFLEACVTKKRRGVLLYRHDCFILTVRKIQRRDYDGMTVALPKGFLELNGFSIKEKG